KSQAGDSIPTLYLTGIQTSAHTLSDAYTSASFADKNIGTAKPVSVSGISISGTDAANYQLSSTSGSTIANITAANLTAQFSISNKVYDATAAATITGSSLQGVMGSDNVSLSGGSASFANKNVGTAKTVTITGLSLSGTDAGNYLLGSSTTTNANITARSL